MNEVDKEYKIAEKVGTAFPKIFMTLVLLRQEASGGELVSAGSDSHAVGEDTWLGHFPIFPPLSAF